MDKVASATGKIHYRRPARGRALHGSLYCTGRSVSFPWPAPPQAQVDCKACVKRAAAEGYDGSEAGAG